MPKLRTVSIDGPYNVSGLSESASRQRLFVCHPGSKQDETNCATKILTNLSRRAYRRQVTSEDVEAPLSFSGYQRSRQSGGGFDDGIRAGVARVLSSPNFLYRIEKGSVARFPRGRCAPGHRC